MKTIAELETIDTVAIMDRHAATTPGDWRECGADRGGCECGIVWATPELPALHMLQQIDGDPLPDHKANVRFASHAHQDIPALVQRVDFLRGSLNYAHSRYDTAEGEVAILKSRLAAVEVERDNALNKLDVANEVITEVRGVCKAGPDELTVLAVRRALRERDDEIGRWREIGVAMVAGAKGAHDGDRDASRAAARSAVERMRAMLPPA